MGAFKISVFILVSLLVLNLSLAEILVQTSSITSIKSSKQVDTHSFIVNLYYPPGASRLQREQAMTGPRVKIEQIVSESSILQCQKANLSFKITNPGTKPEIYLFSAEDLAGTAYITPSLMLNPGEFRIVNYIIAPDCSLNGDLNPKIKVQTRDKEESAIVPSILHVAKGDYLTEEACLYHYNETVCSSQYYIRFYEDTTYEIDLSKWFYDPDSDKLKFTSEQALNLKIEIRGDNAKLVPNKNWHGIETVVFIAEDDKGGAAKSRQFYLHVLDKEESLLERFQNLFS